MFWKNFLPAIFQGKNSPNTLHPLMRAIGPVVGTVVPKTLVFGMAVFLFGCQKQQLQRDILESNMRQHERALQDANVELDNSRATTASLAAENRSFRGLSFLPSLHHSKAAIKHLEFGRGTGGVDEDRANGDEMLQVVVEAKDTDGHTVKAPGTLHLQVYEVTTEGFKQPLSSWDISAEELRKSYKSGLFQSGHILVLPWKVIPNTPKIRLSAQLRLESGQAFEAEKDLTIRLAASPLTTQPRGSIPAGLVPTLPSYNPGPLGGFPTESGVLVLPPPIPTTPSALAPKPSLPETPVPAVTPLPTPLPTPIKPPPALAPLAPVPGAKPIATTPAPAPLAPTIPLPPPAPVPADIPKPAGLPSSTPAPLAPGILSGLPGLAIPPLSTTNPEK